MENLVFTIMLILMPIIYYVSVYKSKKDKAYLDKFNQLYHYDNAPNEYAKTLLSIGSFPYHAFSEKDVDKGIEMDMEYLRMRDNYLESLSLEQHSELIKGMDLYLMGDVSSVREAKRIAKERGYTIK